MKKTEQPEFTTDPIIAAMRHQPRPGLLKPGLVIVAFGAIVNFWIYRMMADFDPWRTEAIFSFVSIGLIMALGGLITLFGVFAPLPFSHRIAIGLGATMFFYICWYSGAYQVEMSRSPHRFDEIWRLGFCIPLVHFSVQIPMWVARVFLRWTIQIEEDEFGEVPQPTDSISDHQHLTIAHMMLGTALAAVSLAVAGYAMKDDSGIPFRNYYSGTLLTTVIIVTLINLFVTMPALLLLRVSSARSGVMAISSYYGFGTLATLFVMIVSSGSGAPNVWDIFLFVSMLAVFSAGLIVPILLVRRAGYRLRWGRETVDVESQVVESND